MSTVANSTGFWHQHTATIDWCETNYQVTQYIAEFWNTVSNLVIILFPFRSLHWCYQHFAHKKRRKNSEYEKSLIFDIPYTIIACNLGLSLVGVGSWFFHMTLKYEMQLLDELPMVYGSAILIYTNYDLIVASIDYETMLLKRNSLNGKKKQKDELLKRLNNYKPAVALLIIGYCLIFTYIYLNIWKNPIFHQFAYGIMVFVLWAQTITIIKRFKLPYRLYVLGMFYYLVGFFLWNIDNIFCDYLRLYRANVEKFFHLNINDSYNNWQSILFNAFAVSLKSISEFHAWWHMFTGYAAYSNILFITEVYYQDHLNKNDLNAEFNEIRPVESTFFDLYHHLTDNLIIHNEKLASISRISSDSDLPKPINNDNIMTRSQTRRSTVKKD